MFDFDAIVLQINIKNITRRTLRLTSDSHPKRDNAAPCFNLKLIGEELWHCHGDGITVYDCQWRKLRLIKLGRWTRSVAALDTKTVVIATQNGLMTISMLGKRTVNVHVHVLCRLYIILLFFFYIISLIVEFDVLQSETNVIMLQDVSCQALPVVTLMRTCLYWET